MKCTHKKKEAVGIAVVLVLGVLALLTFSGTVRFQVFGPTLTNQPGIVDFSPFGIARTISVRCDQVAANAQNDPSLYVVLQQQDIGKWLVSGSVTYRIPECASKACAPQATTTVPIELQSLATVVGTDARVIPSVPAEIATFSPPLPTFTPQQTCFADYILQFTAKPQPGCGAWSTCSNGVQTRTCILNDGSTQVESQSCTTGGGGNGGTPPPQCQQVQQPVCLFTEDVVDGGNDIQGCPLPDTCVANPAKLTVVSVLVFVAGLAGVALWWVKRRKK